MVCDTLLPDNVTFSLRKPVESLKGTSAIHMPAKYIVSIDYIDLFGAAIVPSLCESYRLHDRDTSLRSKR